MNYWDKKLVREQLDTKLEKLKVLTPSLMPSGGWIRLLRDALGMSAAQLGKRVGIDQSRISRLENAEVDGDLKLSSLKKIAEGLDMRFVYAFVPKSSMEDMVYEQGKKIAIKRLNKVDRTMKLEEQGLSDTEKAKALDSLIQKILIDEPKDFWKE